MSLQLYTVKLTALGTYIVEVAADSPDDARELATTAYFNGSERLPDGMTILTREAEATSEISPDQQTKQFEVKSTYSLDFSLKLPARSKSDAETHARRLSDAYGPFEFTHNDDRVGPFTAREVVS